MSDVMRFRHADPKRIVSMPVDSAVVIEVGDMVYLSTDDARNAGAFTYVSADLPKTQANFAKDFLGVAMDSSATGDTANIAIAQAGIFELNCAAAQFEIGDLVGPDDNATPDALLDDQVIAIGQNGYGGIGRVTKRYSANTPRVLVEIFQRSLAPTPIIIPLGQHTIGTADELVTDWICHFPFKAVRMHSIVATVTGAGAEVLSLSKGATDLDDTLTIAATAPVGAVDVVDLDDATGDDIFLAGDLLSVQGDGGTASGAVMVFIEVLPYQMEA